MGIGTALCFTMMINILGNIASELGIMFLNLFLRFVDRGCRFPSSMIGRKNESKGSRIKKRTGDDIQFANPFNDSIE